MVHRRTVFAFLTFALLMTVSRSNADSSSGDSSAPIANTSASAVVEEETTPGAFPEGDAAEISSGNNASGIFADDEGQVSREEVPAPGNASDLAPAEDAIDDASAPRDLEDCWSAMDVTCLQRESARRLRQLWLEDEVPLTDSLLLERLEDRPDDDEDDDDDATTGRSASSDGGLGLGKVAANLEKLLSSRALSLKLWDDVAVRLARSKEHPGYMEISLTFRGASSQPGDEGTGKGTKMNKMLLPLLLGFKTAGAIILGLAATKLLLLKALVVSKLALLAASFLVLKKLLSSVGVQHHPFLYSHYPLPYHHDYGAHHHPHHPHQPGPVGGHGYAGYYSAPSGYAAGHLGVQGVEYLPPSAGGDLQAHFSDNHAATANPGEGSNSTAGARSDTAYHLPPLMLRDTDGFPPSPPAQRKAFSLVKSNANRVPVVTYLRVVSTGRKA